MNRPFKQKTFPLWLFSHDIHQQRGAGVGKFQIFSFSELGEMRGGLVGKFLTVPDMGGGASYSSYLFQIRWDGSEMYILNFYILYLWGYRKI